MPKRAPWFALFGNFLLVTVDNCVRVVYVPKATSLIETQPSVGPLPDAYKGRAPQIPSSSFRPSPSNVLLAVCSTFGLLPDCPAETVSTSNQTLKRKMITLEIGWQWKLVAPVEGVVYHIIPQLRVIMKCVSLNPVLLRLTPS